MATTFKFGNGNWAVKDGYALAYNDENNNFKPLPFDFTRASSATRVNKQGLIETVGSGKPRIDFTDNTSGHLLLEPSRTNKLPYSEDFSEWSTSSGGSVSESQEGVGGSTDAFEFTSDGSANSRIFYAISATGTHSFSVFAKKNTLDYISLYANDDNNSRVWYNLDNGTLGNQEGGGTGTIEDYGGGWYRCTLKWNSSNLVNVRIYNSNANDVFGGTLGSVYIQYAQLEAGSYPTSYIPTEGSSVTRVAETCNQIPPSSIIGQTEGSAYFEYTCNGSDSSGQRIFVLRGDSYIDRIVIFDQAGKIRIYVSDGGVLQLDATTNVDTVSTHKVAFRYKLNDFKLYIDGTAIVTDATFIVPTLNSVYVGTSEGFGGTLGGNVSDVKLYDTALSDSELQALTS